MFASIPFAITRTVKQCRQLATQLILVGQIQLVFAYKKAIRNPLRRELHDQIVLVRAQDDSYRLGIAFAAYLGLEIVQVMFICPMSWCFTIPRLRSIRTKHLSRKL